MEQSLKDTGDLSQAQERPHVVTKMTFWVLDLEVVITHLMFALLVVRIIQGEESGTKKQKWSEVLLLKELKFSCGTK